MPHSDDVSRLLAEHGRGDPEALDRLMPLVYAELRRLAAYHLRAERPGHTLQPTALVHEAYVRLVNQADARIEDRAHFFALAAQVMRHILVDYARARGAGKRGAGRTCIALDDAVEVAAAQDVNLVALDEALCALAAVDPQLGRIVELRYFGGLTVAEVAEVTGVSRATVEREWTAARAWLRRELSS